MKIYTTICLILVGFGYLTLPAVSNASLSTAKAHRKATIACEGKNAGDSVKFINKWKKRIDGICVEKKGVLIAVSAKKIKDQTKPSSKN